MEQRMKSVEDRLEIINQNIFMLNLTKLAKSDNYVDAFHYSSKILPEVSTEHPFQIINSGEIIRLIPRPTTSIGFHISEDHLYFIPPKIGFYRVSLILHGMETITNVEDPIIVYLKTVNQLGEESLIRLTGIYTSMPNFIRCTNPFSPGHMRTYYAELNILMETNVKYSLYISALVNTIDHSSILTELSGMIDGTDYTSVQLQSKRQIVYDQETSGVYVSFMGSH